MPSEHKDTEAMRWATFRGEMSGYKAMPLSHGLWWFQPITHTNQAPKPGLIVRLEKAHA